MKNLIAGIVGVWLVALCGPVTAEAADNGSLRAQLQHFSGLNYRQKKAAVEGLATIESESTLPLLQALLGGEIYFSKTDNSQFYQRRESGAEVQFSPLLGDQLSPGPTAAIKPSSLRKLRVNNAVRKALRQAIAAVQLRVGSEAERLAALETMLGKLDDEAYLRLQQLQPQQSSAAVQDQFQLVLAVHQLGAADSAQRLAALGPLAGRLEPQVRAAIQQAIEAFADDRAFVAEASAALAKTEQRIGFYRFVETLFFGLSLGSVFLLAAIGLAITFGVMGVINMAHGEMIMLGAYTTYVVQLLMPAHLQYSLLVAVPAAFLVSGLFGVLIERGVIQFLHGRPLETLLATFGISLILQQLVRSVFSPLNRQVASPSWMSGAVELNPVLSLTLNRLYILAFSLLVFMLLVYLFKRTNLGLNVRAVSQNRAMAKAMGVKTGWVDALTFGLGSGVAGVAGVALSQLTNVGPNLGQSYIIDSFMVVVFGGVGNLIGTLVGAFSLGVANKFLEPLTGAVMANILVLVFIILFIQKRPQGLFPQRGRAAE
ncbi:MAG: urea ABC transporter permease subunit UrtB [Cellvibrionaceae bacterium]|nr:urea ABC transporter permease subunit UrtB [Cellvibrionaceae bacterium]